MVRISRGRLIEAEIPIRRKLSLKAYAEGVFSIFSAPLRLRAPKL